MEMALSLSVSLLLFFLYETQGTLRNNKGSKAKEQEQVPKFHIEISGIITKYRVTTSTSHTKWANEKNAGMLTKLTLNKDGKFVAKKHLDWIGGTYKLVADIPESEKEGYYELVASSWSYDDERYRFYVYSGDKSPRVIEWDATIESSGMYEKNHDGQVLWHSDGTITRL